MSLFDALLDRLPDFRRGGTDPAAETFEYRCRDCDREFESTTRHVTDAECPTCGSADVRVADDPYL